MQKTKNARGIWDEETGIATERAFRDRHMGFPLLFDTSGFFCAPRFPEDEIRLLIIEKPNWPSWIHAIHDITPPQESSQRRNTRLLKTENDPNTEALMKNQNIVAEVSAARPTGEQLETRP